MKRLMAAFPDAKMLLRMEPEELARYVLDDLKVAQKRNQNQHVRLDSSLDALWGIDSPYRDDTERRQVERAIAEAWGWLTSRGLLVPSPRAHQEGWSMLTRAADAVESPEDFASLRLRQALQLEMLHPTLSDAWYEYVRGKFEAAVVQAFREVEIAVSEAAGQPKHKSGAALIGTDLMRRAFDPDNGPLSDPETQPSERDSLAHFFAGAIGSVRNPVFHRRVGYDDPRETAELLMLASFLLRIVDARVQGKDS